MGKWILADTLGKFLRSPAGVAEEDGRFDFSEAAEPEPAAEPEEDAHEASASRTQDEHDEHDEDAKDPDDIPEASNRAAERRSILRSPDLPDHWTTKEFPSQGWSAVSLHESHQ